MRLIAIIGPAGSGKDTLVRDLLVRFPLDFHKVIVATTRPPRENEEDGMGYSFLSLDDYLARLNAGEILADTEFNGWHYGLLKGAFSKYKRNLGVFNPAMVKLLQSANDFESLKVYCL